MKKNCASDPYIDSKQQTVMGIKLYFYIELIMCWCQHHVCYYTVLNLDSHGQHIAHRTLTVLQHHMTVLFRLRLSWHTHTHWKYTLHRPKYYNVAEIIKYFRDISNPRHSNTTQLNKDPQLCSKHVQPTLTSHVSDRIPYFNNYN